MIELMLGKHSGHSVEGRLGEDKSRKEKGGRRSQG